MPIFNPEDDFRSNTEQRAKIDKLEMDLKNANLTIEELRVATTELQRLLRVDETSGLPNRRALTEDLKTRPAKGKSRQIAFGDLAGFKTLNDAYGHKAGDAALAAIGKILKSVAGAKAYRVGGDEFAMTVEGTPEDAKKIVDQVTAAINEMLVKVKPSQSLLGKKQELYGLSSRFGVGKNIRTAETAMNVVKSLEKTTAIPGLDSRYSTLVRDKKDPNDTQLVGMFLNAARRNNVDESTVMPYIDKILDRAPGVTAAAPPGLPPTPPKPPASAVPEPEDPGKRRRKPKAKATDSAANFILGIEEEAKEVGAQAASSAAQEGAKETVEQLKKETRYRKGGKFVKPGTEGATKEEYTYRRGAGGRWTAGAAGGSGWDAGAQPPPGATSEEGEPLGGSGGKKRKFGMPYTERAALRINYEGMFADAEKKLGVRSLADENIKATVLVTNELGNGLRKLVAVVETTTGALSREVVYQDIPSGAVGGKADIGAVRKERFQVEREERTRNANLAKLADVSKNYGNVYEHVKGKYPALMGTEDLSVKMVEKNNVRRFQFRGTDDQGTGLQADVLTNLSGKILPQVTQRTASFTESIGRNIGEFSKWTIAAGLIYTPMQQLNQLVMDSIKNQTLLANAVITMGKGQESVNTVFNAALDVANKTGVAVTGVIEGYNLAYRATGEVENETQRMVVTNKLLADSITLAKLAQMDQTTATDTLVAALRQTGLGLDQGTVLLDKWVKVSKTANVDVNTLASSFAIVGEAADNAGLSIDELNGLIATVAASGITSAKETGNAVRAMVTGFQSDNAAKELNTFGIAVTTAEGKARTFKDVMVDIRESYEAGMISDDQMNKIGMAIGGGTRRAAQVVTAIVSGDTARVSGVSATASGEAAKALQVQLSTVESSITTLGNSFQKLAQVLGTEGGILGLTTASTKALTVFVEGLSMLVSILDTAAPVMAALGVGKLAGVSEYAGGAIASQIAKGFDRKSQKAIEAEYQTLMGQDSIKSLDPASADFRARRIAEDKVMSANRDRASGIAGKVTSYGAAGLTVAAMALPEFMSGNTAGGLATAGASIAGGFVSNLMGKGPTIGTLIGGTAAQLIISAIEFVKNKGVTGNSDYLNGPATTKDEEEQKASFMKLFSELSSEQQTGYLAIAGKQQVTDAEEMKRIANAGRGYVFQEYIAKGGKTSYAEEAANISSGTNVIAGTASGAERLRSRFGLDAGYQSADKDYYKYLMAGTGSELFTGAGLPFSDLESSVQNEKLIQELIDTNRATLKERLLPTSPSKVSTREFMTKTGELEGYQAKLTSLTAALSIGGYGQAGTEVTDAESAMTLFSEMLLDGSAEVMTELTQLATEIGDIYSKLAEAEKQGPNATILYQGDEKTQDEMRKLLAQRSETYGTGIQQESYSIALQRPVKDIVAYMDLTAEQFNLALSYAIEMRKTELDQMTELERETEQYKDSTIKFYAKLSGDMLQSVEGISPQMVQEAVQRKLDSGEIKLVAREAGFSSMKDITSSQIQQALAMYPERLQQVQSMATAYGATFKENPQQEVVMTADGMQFLDVNMSIFQTLLEQITENTKKTVDGIFNLPDGAVAWVPSNAVLLQPSGTGGGATGLPEGATGQPTATGDGSRPDNYIPGEEIGNYQIRQLIAQSVQSANVRPDDYIPGEELGVRQPTTVTALPDRLNRENLDVDALRQQGIDEVINQRIGDMAVQEQIIGGGVDMYGMLGGIGESITKGLLELFSRPAASTRYGDQADASHDRLLDRRESAALDSIHERRDMPSRMGPSPTESYRRGSSEMTMAPGSLEEAMRRYGQPAIQPTVSTISKTEDTTAASISAAINSLQSIITNAKVNLNITNVSTLLVDGRQMAMVVKKYLKSDLALFSSGNSSANISVV